MYMKTITTTLEIDSPPEQVWDVLIDFPSHERWNPFFSRVVGAAVVGESITITQRKGGGDGMSFTPTIREIEPNRILRWKGKLLIKGIFDGEHIFRLDTLDGGRTVLHHSENFSGILIPLMGKVLADTERGFTDFNTALADEVAARNASTNNA